MEFDDFLKEVNSPGGGRTLSKAEIKRMAERRRLPIDRMAAGSQEPETYISPNFKDGGWHSTPGCVQFTTEWEPRNDKIMLRMDGSCMCGYVGPLKAFDMTCPVHGIGQPITLTDKPDNQTRMGTVLKCGPGKWIPGHWEKLKTKWLKDRDGINRSIGGHWQWVSGTRREMTVKPGMMVVIGPYSDWESGEAGWGENIVICQEADVRAIL